jgi:heavy metal efflux system protein
MPPSASDTFIILKSQEDWPDPHLPKEALLAEIERAVKELPGNVYEFTQPIQMRFNELLAGVRGDIAVKVFGDEFEPLLRAANQIVGILRGIEGASDIRVEQVAGLPVLEIAPDKAEIARRGLSLSTVHEVIGHETAGIHCGSGQRSGLAVCCTHATCSAGNRISEWCVGGGVSTSSRWVPQGPDRNWLCRRS